jgi:hypothetical protein
LPERHQTVTNCEEPVDNYQEKCLQRRMNYEKNLIRLIATKKDEPNTFDRCFPAREVLYTFLKQDGLVEKIHLMANCSRNVTRRESEFDKLNTDISLFLMTLIPAANFKTKKN